MSTTPRIAFHSLPLLARLAVILTLLNTWVLFAEIVIDRSRLWECLPYYRVGQF